MNESKWKIKKSKDDKFYFTLQAVNGEILLTSEMYESRAAAYKGIQAIVKVAPSANVYDLTLEEKTEDGPNQD